MKPWNRLDAATVPGGGGELRLMQRDAEFSIMAGAITLLNSRMSGSETALAELACERLRDRPNCRVLIGGYGMGFTLRAVLAGLGAKAQVVVAELVPAVLEWARGPMAAWTAGCLDDPRLHLVAGDVAAAIAAASRGYDAILLDVDNGPDGVTRGANNQLYSMHGLALAKVALKPGGILAVWSARPDAGFARRLKDAGFKVEEDLRARAKQRQGATARHLARPSALTMSELLSGLYGAPPTHLVDTPGGARQLSPLYPGADDLGAATPGAYSDIVMLAPPGTLERRYVLGQALAALSPGGTLIVVAPNDRGGARLATELAAFGCAVDETSKSHHRICTVRRPLYLTGVDEALVAGAPRLVEAIGLWSQPGVFSWDRIDPGSALLASHLPQFKGCGADFGCGIGYLARTVLKSNTVERLDLVDIDRRAVEAARRNVVDARAYFHWADATGGDLALADLDFVVMNPPFHDAGAEDKGLGQAFIRQAAKALRTGGVCWLVANRHLPYEAVLSGAFRSVRLDHEAAGFKIYEARA